MSARESRPGAVTEAASESWQAHPYRVGDTSGDAEATRLRDAASSIERVTDALAAGTLGLEELRRISAPLFALFTLGWRSGIDSQASRVAQAEHDADRLYVQAMNEPERAEAISRRLDRALASCPPGLEPHTSAYFEHVLRGVLRGR